MFLFKSKETVSGNELNLNEVLKHTQNKALNPIIYEVFKDPDFVKALPQGLREPKVIAQYLEHSSQFLNAKSSNFPMWGQERTVPESLHADARIRRPEIENVLDLKAIAALGIDPSKVLYFRRTQPSKIPKTEYYWTSDYWEVLNGLRAEISVDNRKSSIILCTTLADLACDSELIKDINDDNGISIRRTALGNYDQNRCLFTINPEN